MENVTQDPQNQAAEPQSSQSEGPNQEQTIEKPATVDELRQKISQLKAEVQSAITRAEQEQAAEKTMVKELEQRKERLLKDTRLMPLLNEAERTLKEFTTHMQERLTIDVADTKEFEELTNLVAQLREERDDALKRMRDLGERVAGTIRGTVNGFLQKLENLEMKKAELYLKQEEQKKIVQTAKDHVDEAIKQAVALLPDSAVETARVMQDTKSFTTMHDYLTKLSDQKKSVSWFHFKERSVIKSLIKQENLFAETDQKSKELAQTTQDLQMVSKEVNEVIDQYRELITRIDLTGDSVL